MRQFFTAITAVSALVIVVLVLYAFGRLPGTGSTLTDLESDCLIATIHSDARWAGDSNLAVRREIGRTVLRYARLHKRDICDVFENGLTLVPVGYQRWTPYFRSVRYVYNSLEASAASWKSDAQLVQELLKEKPEGCATHYIRKERKSDVVAQSTFAKKAIRSSMRSVGRTRTEKGEEVGDAEFFCPK